MNTAQFCPIAHITIIYLRFRFILPQLSHALKIPVVSCMSSVWNPRKQKHSHGVEGLKTPSKFIQFTSTSVNLEQSQPF